MNNIKLNTIEEAIEDIGRGKLVIVVDDEDRENEGDFICAAELITPGIVNFMTKHGRGLICVALPEERCEELELDLMVGNNTSLHETQFTVSVDLISPETTTGVSAKDRALTIKALVDPGTRPSDLGRPGHVFPLKAKAKGVIRRAGHTEAAVDLTVLAGLNPGGVLVEIMNDDGSMARLNDLVGLGEKFGIKIVSISDLIKYKLERDTIIEVGERVKLPTDRGEFDFIPFRQISNGLEHGALVKGSWTKDDTVMVRVHSSCFTGDIFGSLRCDCGPQLHRAMEMVEKEGKGVVIYLSQEGRGIGLFNKIKAYRLQDEGMDTVQANLKLGFAEDERDYGVGASIMRALGLGKIKLISNNPVKRAGLEGYGIKIVETIPLIIESNPHNEFYLQTKEKKMGHNLTCYKHLAKDRP
ncbi:MAG TPA: bifunctional 3,4-dihydroxy-2-butanone-4-phosphate synthase/GTP cyclohydrolase II [Bacteroidales bacterium]|jgi:3,4-dihydroxy 2-butanone 4-phosphate synthase/GTP cyclohydrolase II|nr:bifunctional 3,4-dihydroxy-2-butanone-4-phosphate synthase/GTP cyclohydrolase II [Bacteroidales bacterium]HQH25674.1 bifunctional 3,4-dihydroxy-2-butanone-4-phosphate synthase/GTP cyclohydrolase II [Bacteroidales bacterium]HQJ83320.1 bifunctional 3,4-dihydroxy-2-butanone-4-phosphate synthase/GTP cyclohydrolase II [Bacteroidales bacterium]